MKRSTLIVAAVLALAFNVPVYAQRAHPGGGPPAGHGAAGGSGMSNSHAAGAATSHTDMSHASPGGVLSHNTVISSKINALTGEDAATACDGLQQPRQG